MPHWVRFGLALLLAGAVPAGAAPVRITIGAASAAPGGTATVEVGLDPVDQTVIGASNDIELGALTPIRRLAGGGLDCAAAPSAGTVLPPSFVCIAAPPADCLRLRAIVFRPFGDPPFVGGPLYSCNFVVDATAAPGATFPLRIRAAVATGAAGRALETHGESGMIRVIAPTPTPSPSETPVPSATPTLPPTVTPTVTPTSSPSQTRTASRTRTRTATPLTPISTPSSTATPVIGLRASAGTARPGATTLLAVDLTDRGGRVSGVTFDLLVPESVFDAHAVAEACVLDARVAEHALSATAVGDPPPPQDYRRVRLVVSEQTSPALEIGNGPLVACHAPVRETAAPGAYAIGLDRLFAGDVNGTLLLGVGAVSGTLSIDPEAPSPTPTATVTRTASVTATPTATRSATPVPSQTATPTHERSPTPTRAHEPSASPLPTAVASPSPIPTTAHCAGDCDGDGAIAINELVQGVSIAVSGAPASGCTAVDTNADGVVSINELVAAVAGALGGCPDDPA